MKLIKAYRVNWHQSEYASSITPNGSFVVDKEVLINLDHVVKIEHYYYGNLPKPAYNIWNVDTINDHTGHSLRVMSADIDALFYPKPESELPPLSKEELEQLSSDELDELADIILENQANFGGNNE